MDLWTRSCNKVKHEWLRFLVKVSPYEYGINTKSRKEKIIVSLTSYPKRFEKLELCLKSLFLQSMKADRIILWLGSDSVGTDLTSLKQYEKYGLEIRLDEEHNYRSHKKYLYALKEFPEDLVITVDDDLIYPKDLIRSLVETHERYPDSVVARRVHRIIWDENGEPRPYLEWEGECASLMEPSFQLLPTTGAGTLYPPGAVSQRFSDTECFQKHSFLADDIWMKYMSVLNKTRVVWAPNKMQMPTTIDLHQTENLMMVNCDETNNDTCFRALLKEFHLKAEDFSDDKN